MLPRRFLPTPLRTRTHRYQQTQIHKSTSNEPTQTPLLLGTLKRAASSSSNAEKKAAISRAILSNNSHNNQQSASSATVPIADNIFGMRPIDYTVLPPIPRSPPPPPPRPGMKKYIFPLSVVFTAGVVGYFYVNNQNDNLEFWQAMQEGRATLDVGDVHEEEEEEE
jgi:hypothetical protein